MLGTFSLDLMVTCRRCGTRVPVNAITAAAACHACGSSLGLDARFWTRTFAPRCFDEALKLPEGQARSLNEVGSRELSYSYGYRRSPKCGRCASYIPLAHLQEQVGGSVRCPRCHQPICVRPADELCRALHSGARWVVGEVGGVAELDRRSEPILFACQACGAGLPVDGAARTVACRYCEAANYLPDGLWRELVPQPTLAWVDLVCELSPRQILLFARRPSTERATRQALATHANDKVRAGLAAMGSVEASIAGILAGDRHPAVRRALAGNPRIHHDILADLARDRDPAVRAAVAGNGAASRELLRGLGTDLDPRVREAVARHPSAPVELRREPPAVPGKGTAWLSVLGFAVLFAGLIALVWMRGADGALGRAAGAVPIAVLLGWGALLLVVFVLALSRTRRPLTGRGGRAWSSHVLIDPAVGILLFPAVGSLLALLQAAVLARGRVGPSRVGSEGNHTHYDAVELRRGEGRPAAALLASSAVLYLLLAALLVGHGLRSGIVSIG